jgi:ATP-dependent DNA helicase RecG
MYSIEKSEYPVTALREMLLNSMVHRSYMGSFSQMRVYDDKINLWNEGGLPDGITLEALKRSHKSKPRNLLIADVCFKGGLIDAWGRGTISIIDACKEAGLAGTRIDRRRRRIYGNTLQKQFDRRTVEETRIE